MPLFRTHSPPPPTPRMPLTRAPQYNEEAAPRSTIFTHRSPERLRAESVTGSYSSNDSHGALVTQPPPRSRRGLFRRHSSDSVLSDRRLSPAPHPPPSRGLGGSTLEHRETTKHAVSGGHSCGAMEAMCTAGRCLLLARRLDSQKWLSVVLSSEHTLFYLEWK